MKWSDLRTLIFSKEEQILNKLSYFSNEQIEDFKQMEAFRVEILLKDPRLIVEYIKDNDQKIKLKYSYETMTNYLESVQEIKRNYTD